MLNNRKPSQWQQAIEGQWHGCPSLFESDGTHVGYNKVSRASEFSNGCTTYWMDTKFNATGPLNDRFEIGTRMEFGVIDSDKDRIYTGPDFIGSGRPFGLLVDSNYYSPGWNVNLRTLNHIVPDLGIQVYSSQLFEADTLVGVFNGLYINTQIDHEQKETQHKINTFLKKEKKDGKKPFNLPVKHEGVYRGKFEVYDNQQKFIGFNEVTIIHTPINLLHSEQIIKISGIINCQWTSLRTRNANHMQYHGPDLYGNGISYGRYLYSVRHIFGEACKLWSRETIVDDSYSMVCAWQFFESQSEKYMTFGLLRWEKGLNVLKANHIK